VYKRVLIYLGGRCCEVYCGPGQEEDGPDLGHGQGKP
jgi:hypothetical protein